MPKKVHLNQCNKPDAPGCCGVGIGLRPPHYLEVAENPKNIPWIEIVSENFFTDGRPLFFLEKIRKDVPVVMHGVSLSIASIELDRIPYLTELKKLADKIEPEFISDHLCWTSTLQHNTFDLLPFPYTQESLNVVTQNIDSVQSFLGRPILLENISQYVQFKESEMHEEEFLTEICKRTGCGILLDVNNVFVNSFNFNFDPLSFFEKVPPQFVKQMHIAGHSVMDDFLFDTHVGPVPENVVTLFKKILCRYSNTPILLEWDTDVPSLEILLQERERLQKIYQESISA